MLPRFATPVTLAGVQNRRMSWGAEAVAEARAQFGNDGETKQVALVEVTESTPEVDQSLLLRNCGLCEGTINVCALTTDRILSSSAYFLVLFEF